MTSVSHTVLPCQGNRQNVQKIFSLFFFVIVQREDQNASRLVPILESIVKEVDKSYKNTKLIDGEIRANQVAKVNNFNVVKIFLLKFNIVKMENL